LVRTPFLIPPLVLAVVATACGRPDAPAGDPLADAPPPVDAAPAPSAAGTPPTRAGAIPLRAMGGSGVSGEAHVTGGDGRTEIHIMVRGADPGVRLQPNLVTGTCDDPGGGVADLDPFFVDDAGAGSATVTAAVGAGEFSLVVQQPERQPDPIVACAEIGGASAAGGI
jgi:hypothetical protein